MGISHKRDIVCHAGRHRAKRPRTFSSEDKAKKWAESQGIKNFNIVRLNSGLSKKLKIVKK